MTDLLFLFIGMVIGGVFGWTWGWTARDIGFAWNPGKKGSQKDLGHPPP